MLLIILFCTDKVCAQRLFNDTVLHEIKITFPTANWYDTLAAYYDATNNTDDKKTLNAFIEVDQVALPAPVAIRFKGEYSYKGFPGPKKPFRLNVSKSDKEQQLNGTKKFNLHNLAGDPSFLREYIAYDFMRYQGIPASRTAFTRLYINDIYWGCYLIVEEPEDNYFLERNFGTKSGNLFEADLTTDLHWKGHDPEAYTELKLQTKDKDGAWDKLISWMDLFNNYYQTDFQQQLYKTFETEAYLKVLATDVFTDNWDSYAANGRNFFVYEHPETTKLNWVPWDYNLSFWEKNLPPFPKYTNDRYQPLIWRIYDNPYLKRQYLETLCRTINYAAADYPLEERITRQRALIADAVMADSLKFYTNTDFNTNYQDAVTVTMQRGGVDKPVYLPGLISHWKKRRNSLRKELMALGCNCDEVDNKESEQPLVLACYPSPATNILHIYTESHLTALRYAIYTINGSLYTEGMLQLKDGSTVLNCSAYPAGMYYLVTYLHNKKSTNTFIKQ